ncbi:aspartoacylase [Teredinibacter turnerae]|uniref:aspartoacylase n=1 Tax=Teredinibacter turnerae TaxID=2426 RepID=UPI00035E3D47|nr:aspartoacylase [Teredinibacter turnerae]
MINSIENVAVTGGTHGNELTGVYLVKHWLSHPEEVKRPSFLTELHFSNPSAIDEIRRYVDQDLNRQFNIEDLNNPDLRGREQQRAKYLNELLGPKENPRIDFVIDMHTTTTNMGTSLIFNSGDPLEVGMAFYIKQHMPDAALFYNPSDRLQDNFLRSMGRLGGLVIEVGPIAQGLLNYQVYSDVQTAVMHALDYLELRNTGQDIPLPQKMEGYRFLKKIPLPENAEGEIDAMIHPNLQNKDYQAINPGDPLFITLAGETIPYDGEQTVYGAFINEAAYYDRHIGLSLMEKIQISLEGQHS